ncbi:MAG: cysteine desulfurase family protein [archaeon]
MKTIYLDNSATTPVRKEVLSEALPYFSEVYGNPSSFHSTGLVAKQAINKSRKIISKILNCNENEIIFTGSGTESINLAIKGVAFVELLKNKGVAKGHFITQKTEHDAVLESFEWIEKLGFDVSYINVDKHGLVNLDELKKAIRKDTLLVSIMYANNEVGTIQPLKEISKICHAQNILFHTDACQGAEYLELNVKKLGIDMMTINGSKIYAFKGSGLLYLKNGIKIEPLIHGGGHENKMRAGTENTPAIIAMAKALEIAQKENKKESVRLTKLRDYMINKIQKEISKTKLNGHPTKRLPNNVNFSFYGIEGESLLLMLNEKGIRVSTGSACSSQSLDPSHVLMAMGLEHGLAHSSTRFSFGKYTTKKDIDFTIKELKQVVKKLRAISPVWEE